jgi:hypothetical protein
LRYQHLSFNMNIIDDRYSEDAAITIEIILPKDMFEEN